MCRSGGVLWANTVVLMVAVTAAMITCVVAVGRTPVHHLVGGKDLWKPDYNYTDWSLNETFYVGDLLHFVYEKHMYTVLEVNETSYKNCTGQGFIFNITGGNGSDVFELTTPKPYYFIAGGGYCYNNHMKLAVNVVKFVPVDQTPPLAYFFLGAAIWTILFFNE